MRKPIDEETRQKAIRLYKNKNLLISEIANLVGVSQPSLTLIYNEAFANGTLKPRRPDFALTPRVPNGQGVSRKVSSGRKRGNPHWGENKKFNDTQELEIATDYYKNGLSTKQIMSKYNCHPMQLQSIRQKYSKYFGTKKLGRPRKEMKNGT